MRETEPIVAGWSRQRWEKGTRYYEARLHPDLWGDWMLTVGWGGGALGWSDTEPALCILRRGVTLLGGGREATGPTRLSEGQPLCWTWLNF
ncbi:MAG: hypothetical protein IPL59_08735 [Candidatus Competibacteraceae bacterium]|nr:hypothetical protein [Candidatus Competibacteraceae bacterium]